MTLDRGTRISGKVAAILTRRELIINRGVADGVQVGMQFAVLNRHGIDVKDPDTGKVIGSTEIVKTIVKIVRLEGDHLAVGRTFRTIPGHGPLGLASTFGLLSGQPDRVETLSIEGSGLKEELDPKDSYIKIGDPVIEAKGDEYEDQ